MFETHPAYELPNATFRPLIYLSGGLLLLLLAYTTFRLEIEPFWVLCAVPFALLIVILVQEFPVLLMVALVYVGSFKTQAAVGVSLTDPTLLTAALLYGAIALQVLLHAVGAGGRSLRDLFAGQLGGVAAFCLLILVIEVSYAYTPAPVIGSEKVLNLLVFAVPIFFAPLILLRTDRDVRQLLFFCIAGSLILTGRTVLRVMHPSSDLLLGQNDPTEIGEGLLMGTALLMALYYSFERSRILRLGLVASIVILACGVAASLSRSAILSVLIIAIGSFIFLRRHPMAVSRKAIFTTATIAVVAVFITSVWLWHLPVTHAKFAHKVEEFALVLQGTPGGTAGERYSFAQSAWNGFLSKPLLGLGAGGFSTLWHYSDERILKYPHNFVLEIASEQGVAGLSALAWLLLAMLGACRRILQAGRPYVFIVPIISLILLGNIVSGQVETRDLWFWCGTLFALARISCSSSKAIPENGNLTLRHRVTRLP